METRACTKPTCDDVQVFCHAANETGRLARAFCPSSCGCDYPLSPLALSLPYWGCPEGAKSGAFREHLAALPCEDVTNVSSYGHVYDRELSRSTGWNWKHEWNVTRLDLFAAFLDSMEKAAFILTLTDARTVINDVKYLRMYGCEYLSNPKLWDSMDAYTWYTDARNKGLGLNDKARPPYLRGMNLCIRGAKNMKPLSFWCPVACGCTREDMDCPLTCPARQDVDDVCPPWQRTTELSHPYWDEPPYRPCAQRPLVQPVAVGSASGSNASHVNLDVLGSVGPKLEDLLARAPPRPLS